MSKKKTRKLKNESHLELCLKITTVCVHFETKIEIALYIFLATHIEVKFIWFYAKVCFGRLVL